MKPLLGAILAGGLSTRMGADKPTLRLGDGRMMIEHVAWALRGVCYEIILVGGSHEIAAAAGFLHVKDLRLLAGPLGGIEALLASDLAREYLVCPCDLPFITKDVLRLLLQQPESPASVLRRPHQANFDPLPARIASSALPMVQGLLDSGERSVWRLMKQLHAAVVELDSEHAAALRNINTPAELNTP